MSATRAWTASRAEPSSDEKAWAAGDEPGRKRPRCDEARAENAALLHAPTPKRARQDAADAPRSHAAAEAQVCAGLAHARAGRWEDARRAFQAATDDDPRCGDAWHALAFSLYKLAGDAHTVHSLEEGPDKVSATQLYNAVVCLFLAAKAESETRTFLCEFFKGVEQLFSPDRKLVTAKLAAADELYDQIEAEKNAKALDEKRAARKAHMLKVIEQKAAAEKAAKEAASSSASASKRSRN